MTPDNCYLIATRENYSSKIIHYSRFLQMGLAVFILLLLASAHSVPTINLLWLVALVTLSGGIFAQLAYYFPLMQTMEMNYLYIYELLMTIWTAVSVPLSTYCTSYQMKDDKSSTLYIALALLCIFLATSFLLSLLIRYDFDPFAKSSRSEVSRSTIRSDEQHSLLPTYSGYGNYQAF